MLQHAATQKCSMKETCDMCHDDEGKIPCKRNVHILMLHIANWPVHVYTNKYA